MKPTTSSNEEFLDKPDMKMMRDSAAPGVKASSVKLVTIWQFF